ncbi:hypothetical protein [Clostridium transplantifaecale]|uniref:hypothetical protein n=1 Tax=Clostridium transplantifaecale TaxID=2479838 RepID=UPI0013DD8A9F|nr:hypothetical protein [Clostridium transplantifaecale]
MRKEEIASKIKHNKGKETVIDNKPENQLVNYAEGVFKNETVDIGQERKQYGEITDNRR